MKLIAKIIGAMIFVAAALFSFVAYIAAQPLKEFGQCEMLKLEKQIPKADQTNYLDSCMATYGYKPVNYCKFNEFDLTYRAASCYRSPLMFWIQ